MIGISIVGINLAYADSTVSIPSGSSVPGCEVTNECYIPYEVSVSLGGEVTWVNNDSAAHTVTSGHPSDGPDGLFDSSLFMSGAEFSVTFDQSGTYPYFCLVHPWMIGIVEVEGSSSSGSSDNGGTSYPPPNHNADITVARGSSVPGCEESDRCYVPFEYSTKVGNTVSWYNADSAAHTVTSGHPGDGPDGAFDSSLFMAGSTFSHRFDESGTFNYFCMVHPWMEGIVVVQDTRQNIPDVLPRSTSSPTTSLADGTVLSISAGDINAGQRMSVGIEFENAEHVNYNMKVTQNSQVVLDDMGVHDHDGKMNHMTAPLPSNSNVDVQVIFNGYGIPGQGPFTGPIGETIIFRNMGHVASPSPTPTPIPTPTASLDISTSSSEYSPGDIVTVNIKSSGNSNVAVSVIDSEGTNIVTRSVFTERSGQLQFKISESSPSGRYTVDATSTISGIQVSDSTSFSVKSASGKISILSVQPTDQQGNTVSSFSKEKLSFVKVILSSDANKESLVTVNLFDSDLTSLGIGSFKTTLSPGQSEIILSFFIPNDAVSGNANIYTNVFSDWPSQDGVPLTAEKQATVRIQ